MFKLLVVISFCVVSAVAYGQTALATITGTVADATGAVVADVPVAVRNVETGQLFSASTSGTGNYTVAQLPVGEYNLTVTAPGFKVYTHAGFRLAAQQTMREDITLTLGATSESVTVTAESSLLKTESSEIVHNVTISQLNDLPVLPIGSTGAGFRDPFALAKMLPGTSYTAGTTMVINGNPNGTVQFRLDGMTMGNTGANRNLTQFTQASADAVQEVAVQTSNYAAEFGAAGGGVFNMVMKSGTNALHGGAYDYAVNEVLNAATPYTGLKNTQRRHDYGFTVGGPVVLPKLYNGRNKTFFFWSWEQYRERAVVTTTSPTVPIEAYRQGNFGTLLSVENRALRANGVNYVDPLGRAVLSGMIFDPATTRPAPSGSGTIRDQFPTNSIPVTRFDPISVKVLQLVPSPKGINATNGSIGNNFQVPWTSQRATRLPSIKIDHAVGSKGRLSGYFQQTVNPTQYQAGPGQGDGLPEPITQARGTFIYSFTERINYDHTLTPTLLLHFGAGWNSMNFSDHAGTLDYNALSTLGLKGATIIRTFPKLVFTAPTQATGGMTSLGPSPQSDNFERRPMGTVSANWVRGNHTVKFGSEYRLEKFPVRTFTDASGTYTFGSTALLNSTVQTSLNGQTVQTGFHGFDFASFLLGDLKAAQLAQIASPQPTKSQWALYLQDSWKLTRKLTFDYGVRWDYGTYAREQYGRNGNFNPTVANPSAGGHPGGYIYESTCNCRFAANYPYAIGPRIGAAYQINTKTVLRAGIGVVYSATEIASGSSVNGAATGDPGYGQVVGQFRDGIPSNVQPIWPNFASNAGQPNGAVVAAPQFLDPNAGRPARQLQWSINLQREVTRNFVVEAAYIANRGSWWTGGSGLAALNALQISDLTSRGFQNLALKSESDLLTLPYASLSAAQKSTLASRNIGFPYSTFPTALTTRQMLLNYPQYNTAISPASAPLGKTWYDALQLTATHRMSHGLSFSANYTYSKNLDLMNSVDIYNRPLGKNFTAFDLPHQLRLSGEYVTPGLTNSALKLLSNRVVSTVLGGWTLGWFLQYQSAAVLARPASQGAVPLSNFLGRGPGSAQLKIGADGNSMNPFAVNWTDYDGKVHAEPLDINCHCFDPTKTQLLNPAAWSDIPDGQWAAQTTDIRSYRGIRQPQESLNLGKNFHLREKMTVHIRVEFQNVFNRTRLPQPVVTGSYKNAPTKFTTGANVGLFNGGFGTVLPTAGTAGQRAGTLVARFTF
ncbi:MAG: TonB-dependent receptor [Acidobacteriota bacterium]